MDEEIVLKTITVSIPGTAGSIPVPSASWKVRIVWSSASHC